MNQKKKETAMRSVARKGGKGKKQRVFGEPRIVSREEVATLDLDGRVAFIQALIPLGLLAAVEMFAGEVEQWAGVRYGRKGAMPYRRHGANLGSVRLGGQRHRVRVPRVRGPRGEVPLASYARLHRGGEVDETLLRRVLYGLSCRNYEAAAEAAPGALGLSPSSVSRRVVTASAEKLRQFQERDLSELDVVALFLDGKSFADEQMVLALGVTVDGRKAPLGFVQTTTENERVLTEFLRSLVQRGLRVTAGVLVIIDGGKGLRAAVEKVFRERAMVQRCQWHKRENVVSYLPKGEQQRWRRRLQRAYERPTYAEAKRELVALRRELEALNLSAARSLDEGFEESLTLHRLGLFPLLGRSFKTTNCIESVHALVEERCGKVDAWKNSSQRQRWYAAALLDIEPRLRKVHGYRHLPLLRERLMRELKLEPESVSSVEAA